MVDDVLKFREASREDPDALSEPIRSLIGGAYLPPRGDDAYWARLEGRIMARVASADAGWWSELAPWAQRGLVAAAAIFALASVINRQIAVRDEHFASYESVVVGSEAFAGSQELVSVQEIETENDAAALRYFLSN